MGFHWLLGVRGGLYGAFLISSNRLRFFNPLWVYICILVIFLVWGFYSENFAFPCNKSNFFLFHIKSSSVFIFFRTVLARIGVFDGYFLARPRVKEIDGLLKYIFFRTVLARIGLTIFFIIKSLSQDGILLAGARAKDDCLKFGLEQERKKMMV